MALALTQLRTSNRVSSILDIVFVHGLGDNDIDAWQQRGDPSTSWPHWLATDHDDVSVWLLQYGAAKFWFGGTAMALPDRAKSVLSYIVDSKLGNRPIFFVTHSLGGLVVKQLLRSSQTDGDARLAAVASATRGVIFLATPHSGSAFASAATFLKLESKSTKDLGVDDPWLRDLDGWYRNNAERQGWVTRAFYETRPIAGTPTLVVSYSSADPHVKGVTAIGVEDADHISICKPKSKNAEVYKAVESIVASLRRDAASPPPVEPYEYDATLVDPQAIRPTSSFTGRTRELAAIGTALEQRDRRAVIYGLAGTGKSAIARQFARSRRHRYFAIGWLAAETPIGIIDGLIWLGARFATGLDQKQDRASAAREAITILTRKAGANRRILLIFDNLEDRRLLTEWAPVDVDLLVTSRVAGWGVEMPTIRLEDWPIGDAATYLLRESGRTDVPTDEAEGIVIRLGCLPLAVAHAAAYMRNMATTTAARYLMRIEERMALAPDDADYPKAVTATFQELIAKVEERSAGVAALLCFAGFFAPNAVPNELYRRAPSNYARDLLPVIPGATRVARGLRDLVEAGATDDAIGILHRFSLVSFNAVTQTFSVHRLVASAARDLCSDERERWVKSAIDVMDNAFPRVEYETWQACERLITHAQAALEGLPADVGLLSAGRLATKCGRYLAERAAFREAEHCYRRALSLVERQYGAYHPNVATTLNNLAILLHATNRLSEAEVLYRRALAIDEVRIDDAKANVARDLNNLAIFLRETNRPVEAEEHYRRALAIDETLFGHDHPKIAMRLNNLAKLLRETGRLDEAEPLHRRSLTIDERHFGPNHPYVAIDLSNLALWLHETGQTDEAEALHRRALAINESSYGGEHPCAARDLNNIAELLIESGRIHDAEPLLRRALSIDEAVYGPDHPNVASILNGLAEYLQQTNQIVEAERVCRRALTIVETSYGGWHPAVARDLVRLGLLLIPQGRLAEAETAYRRARSIFDSSIIGKNRRMMVALRSLEALLAATRTLAEADARDPRTFALETEPSEGTPTNDREPAGPALPAKNACSESRMR